MGDKRRTITKNRNAEKRIMQSQEKVSDTFHDSNMIEKEITLKSGKVIPVGSFISWTENTARVISPQREFLCNVSFKSAAAMLSRSAPDFEELEYWSYDGISESVNGDSVEPDGYGPDGAPSWLIVYGMI
jgi:hypothetical protein